MHALTLPVTILWLTIIATVMAAEIKQPPSDLTQKIYRNSPNIGPDTPSVDLSEFDEATQRSITSAYQRTHAYVRKKMNVRPPRRPHLFTQREIDEAKRTLEATLEGRIRQERRLALTRVTTMMKNLKKQFAAREELKSKAERLAERHAWNKNGINRGKAKDLERRYREQVKTHERWLERHRAKYEKLRKRRDELRRALGDPGDDERKEAGRQGWMDEKASTATEMEESDAEGGWTTGLTLTSKKDENGVVRSDKQSGLGETAMSWLARIGQGLEKAAGPVPPSAGFPRGTMRSFKFLNP